MKGKLLLIVSVLFFAAFGFWVMKSLFLNNSEILNVPDSGLLFEIPEKTFKMIESDGEPIRISLGQVDRKAAVIEILLGENNLKKQEIKKGETLDFIYEKNIYTLKLEDIKAKLIGEETAVFKLFKKGHKKDVAVEKSVSEFFDMIEKEEFEVYRSRGKLGMKSADKIRFLKKLKYKSRKQITIDGLIQEAEDHFGKYTIKQNNQEYPVAVWLSMKK